MCGCMLKAKGCLAGSLNGYFLTAARGHTARLIAMWLLHVPCKSLAYPDRVHLDGSKSERDVVQKQHAIMLSLQIS